MTDSVENRCRLVLVVPDDADEGQLAPRLEAAFAAGDVASVIVPAHGRDEDRYQALLESVAPVVQPAGVALVAAGPANIAARAKVDGIHLPADAAIVADHVERYAGRWIVGAEAGGTRHHALEMGEKRPDYMFFGRLSGDTHAEPHPVALENAAWWAEFVEIPAILMGGHDLSHLETAARTGAEFVALSRAALAGDADPADVVKRANAVLERFRFEDAA